MVLASQITPVKTCGFWFQTGVARALSENESAVAAQALGTGKHCSSIYTWPTCQ